MKKRTLIISLLGVMLFSFSSYADCYLYEGRYSYEILAHFKDDKPFLYKGRYGLTPMAHLNDDQTKLLEGRFGYTVLAHLKPGTVVYNDQYSYDAIAHLKDDDKEYVYEDRFSYNILVHTKDDQCTKGQLLLGTAALLKLGIL